MYLNSCKYLGHNIILEIISEALIQPGITPPMASNQVSEPHMSGFMRNNLSNSIFVIW